MKVLVTGAKGFLGRCVVAEFLKRGHAVRALMRPGAEHGPSPWERPAEIFEADLRTHKSLIDAFGGVDVLVHLAAAVSGGEEAQFNATVVATERLLDAMARSNTKRIVLASSFSVYDWSAVRGTLDETSPVEAEVYGRDAYAIAKIWQERVVRAASEKQGWSLTVMRPGFIWGPGHENSAGAALSFGKVHLVVGAPKAVPLTHVENCAHAFADAAEDPKAAGQTFNVVDDSRVSRWRYIGECMKHAHKKGFRLYMPYGLGLGLSQLVYATAMAVSGGKAKLPGLFIPCRFEARFKPLNFPNKKLHELLGWKQPFSFEQCLQRTYA